jgi:hypothetical protein
MLRTLPAVKNFSKISTQINGCGVFGPRTAGDKVGWIPISPGDRETEFDRNASYRSSSDLRELMPKKDRTRHTTSARRACLHNAEPADKSRLPRPYSPLPAPSSMIFSPAIRSVSASK